MASGNSGNPVWGSSLDDPAAVEEVPADDSDPALEVTPPPSVVSVASVPESPDEVSPFPLPPPPFDPPPPPPPPEPFTVTVPFMDGWNSQTYLNVPALSNVNE